MEKDFFLLLLLLHLFGIRNFWEGGGGGKGNGAAKQDNS